MGAPGSSSGRFQQPDPPAAAVRPLQGARGESLHHRPTAERKRRRTGAPTCSISAISAPSPRRDHLFPSRRSLDSTAETEPKEPKTPAGTSARGEKKKERSGKKKKKGGKGNKGKKKGREASEKDRAALQLFLDGLKGTRRLMVRALSSQGEKRRPDGRGSPIR